MSLVENAIAFFRIPSGNPALVTAQMRALSRKMPLMYTIIIISVASLAYTHYPYAPVWMTLVLPAVMVAISIIRLITYWRTTRRVIGESEARERLKTAALMSSALSLAFVSWALALTQYGTPYTQGHVIFFVGATAFGNAASVMHDRPALIAMVGGMIVPLVAYLAFSGNVVYMAMSLTVLGVAAAISMVLLGSSLDFQKLIESGHALEKERAAAHALSVANFELAATDSLTGLKNRRGFFQMLERALAERGATGRIAVGLLDLDGFKPVNDVYGHPAGDNVLIEVGRRLALLGPDYAVARLGGDEFGLVLTGFADEEDLFARASSVCERMRVPFDFESFATQMTGSIGLAAVSADCVDAEGLFKRADHALYHAKRHVNGGVVLFSNEHADEIRRTLGLERRLRDADLERELSLAYQLVYDSRAGAIVGVEALARWTNPVVGVVPPDTFIRIAERSGLIGTLTETLFRKLLADVADWPDHIFVSFNLSAHDICTPELIVRLIGIADRVGIDPRRLTFEITETSVMQNFDRAQVSLRLLKQFGAKIALDDFGTGHSSLSYVHILPLDRVKVDRSFIAEIEHSPVTRAVVQTILDLCIHLDLDCIIEGVETEGQLQLMQDMGCTTFQGYLFSRPLDRAATGRVLDAGRHQPMTA